MSKKKILTYENQLNELGIKYNRLMQLLSKDYPTAIERNYIDMINDTNYQQFVSRYKWEGLPDYIPSFMPERLLYYRGSFCVFFKGGKLKMLPYVIEGKLNENGYPDKIRPVPFNGDIYYKIITPYANANSNINADCTIVYDRVPGFTTSLVVPRISLDRDIIELLSKTLNKAEINLDNSSKKLVYKTESAEQADAIQRNVAKNYNSPSPFVVVVDEENATSEGLYNQGVNNECEEIMQFYSAINNLRCYNLGIKNNGMFEKSERLVTAELTGSEYQTNLILSTGLELRKKAIEDLKKIYPEYLDILNKIKVSINQDPYVNLAAKVNENNSAKDKKVGGALVNE